MDNDIAGVALCLKIKDDRISIWPDNFPAPYSYGQLLFSEPSLREALLLSGRRRKIKTKQKTANGHLKEYPCGNLRGKVRFI